MNVLTDAFDIALQVREEAIGRILQAMHQAGAIQHHYARNYGGKHVELQISSPQLSFVTASHPDQRARALVASPVYYHSRDLADARDPGTGAVADVTIRSILQISTGDPAPLAGGADLVVNWQETTRNDIKVYGVPVQVENEVKNALLDFIRDEGRGGFAIPAIGSAAGQIGSLAFRFLSPGPNAGPILVIGMNSGSAVKGSKAGLQHSLVQQDWAFALSSEFILSEIRKSLQQQFGSLPPPVGAAPITLSESIVCTIPTPFGCVDSALQRVILENFDVSLESGAIVFSGLATQQTDAWHIPAVSATFRAEATVSIGADQSLQVSVSQPAVQLQQWYAQVFNFLSFNALEAAVRDGVRAALQSGAQQGQLSSIFSSEMLAGLAAVGTTASLKITPAASFVQIRSEAVIIHGSLAVANSSASPQAVLVALPMASATRRILHAGFSWAPGGQITQYQWDFGDGTSEVSAGSNVRFVTQHDYTAGSYSTCLTVTDNSGRISSVCKSVQPGILTLRHVPAPSSGREWQVCEAGRTIQVDFEVTSDGPVAGVLITVAGTGWQISEYTNGNGKVYFVLDPSQVRNAGIAETPPSRWHKGAVRVTAAKAGYQQSQNVLWMFDCDGIWKVVLEAKAAREAWLDRLAGYAALRDLIASGTLDRPRLDLDPREHAAAEIVFAVDVLTRLTQVLEINSGVLPITDLFGIDPQLGELDQVLRTKFEELWNGVDAAANAFECTYGMKEGGYPCGPR